MICKNFENWVLTKEVFTKENSSVDDKHRKHMQRCKPCACLYEVDQALERIVQLNFQQAALPDSLYDKINTAIDHASQPNPEE